MSQNGEEMVKKCEVVVDATNNVQNIQNSSSNTLKNVRKKIRNFTIRRKADENLIKSDSIDDQKDMNRDKSSDESLGKSKITLKKIFRKSSFRKFINNIQNFTNFTVSVQLTVLCEPQHSFIIRGEREKKKEKTELSIVRRRGIMLDSLE